MAFLHSMQSKSALHGPAMFMMNSGFTRPGFPSMGSWVTYGLGSMNEDLPAYVVLPDVRGLPPGGVSNWGAGFLPAEYQGTTLEVSSEKPPITDLFPNQRYAENSANKDTAQRFLQYLNNQHAAARKEEELNARIATYELAAKLQLSAPESTDVTQESATTQELYGLAHPEEGSFGRQCLLARRLVERGVRFVQIFCGAENTTAKKIRPNWDSHEDLPRDHGYWGAVLDRGASALLSDLKERGLLESTLVICTTEFGRQPAAQGGRGRDHNAGAFTAWMAGGGIRGGISYGATDELGYQAAENPLFCYDLHATALHLLGIDHEKLTYYNNGIQRRLTDVHGHVIREIFL
jgi:arylsulfatase A-like enzyme